MDAQTGSALYLDDVNGDGKTDIVNSYLHGNISWIAVDYVGGEVVFERTMIDEALDYAFDVNCIDVNSDLKKDVLVSTLTVPGLHWYEAPANSGDPWTQHTVSTTFNGTDIYTGDINGDMKIDLAVSGAYTDKISWFEYAWVSGEYQWTEHVIDDGVNDPGDISLDDIDKDGDLDLVVAGLREDQMIWYENRLNDWDDDEILNAFDNCPATPNGPLLGTCVKAVSGVVVGMGTACNTTGDCAAGETCDLAQGDINGNGCGNACECYADINDSGKVDLSDLVIMKGEFAKSCPPSPCAADNNGDGKVDLQDLVVMKIQFLRTGCPC